MTTFRPSRRTFLASGLAVGGSLLAGPSAFAESMTAAPTAAPTPAAALARLKAGNARFVKGKSNNAQAEISVRRAELAEGQSPFAVVLGCADSRLPPELVFDQSLGQLFVVRVAGNTAAAPPIVGSVEYSTAVLGSSLVVVLGHDDCGAVKAAIDVVTKGKAFPGELDGFINPIIPAVQSVVGTDPSQLLQAAIVANIKQTVAALQAETLLSSDAANGALQVVGAEYRLHSGTVDFLT
jgi:carbonic anhydrase